MLEEALLRDNVQALLAKERQAEKAYGELIAKVDDATLKEQLEQLRRDKQRHIRLAERLLEILE